MRLLKKVQVTESGNVLAFRAAYEIIDDAPSTSGINPTWVSGPWRDTKEEAEVDMKTLEK